MPSFLLQAACETLWPTRCAVCDAPAALLCDQCARNLRYIDFYQACPICGSPWGRIQCDTCNPTAQQFKPRIGSCVSCLEYDEATARIVKTYKDKGEQHLDGVMASIMAHIIEPSWLNWAQGVTFVPATRAAVKRRGFDHASLLASSFARIVGLPCIALIEPAQTTDQRILGRKERRENIEGRFKAPRARAFERVIVIDDVLTTGATIAGARSALKRQGCAVKSVTFARV